jgi:hypothetical protein
LANTAPVYARLAAPVGSDPVAIFNGTTALTTILNDCVAVCEGLLVAACTVNVKLPAVVVVPETRPVEETEKPGGRTPDTNNHVGEGGPLATSCCA